MAHRRPVLLLAFLLSWLLCGPAFAAKLTVYFFDVGQGDAALIVSPAGKTVLVDAGPPEAGEKLASRLKQLLTAPLDLVVMTHPHADHLGGMEKVIRAVGARIFMEPGLDHASPLYRDLLQALEEEQVPVKIGEAGRNVDLGGGASLRLLAPQQPMLGGTRSDANANSIVMRLSFGDTGIYFAADSEEETERRVLRSNEEGLRSDVYKVAHHASRHSSTRPLLSAIRPSIAVVSVGANNDYGHPSRQAIDRLEAAGAAVYRTDLDGEIVVTSDGSRVQVSTERGSPAAVAEPVVVEQKPARKDPSRAKPVASARTKPEQKPKVEQALAVPPPPPPPPAPAHKKAAEYWGSIKSTVFHNPDCEFAKKIKPTNLMVYKTRDEALEAGRTPAGCCNP